MNMTIKIVNGLYFQRSGMGPNFYIFTLLVLNSLEQQSGNS
jgi:hypothetical protein